MTTPSNWGQASWGLGVAPQYSEDPVTGGRTLLNPEDFPNMNGVNPSMENRGNVADSWSKFEPQLRQAGYTGSLKDIYQSSGYGIDAVNNTYDDPELQKWLKEQGISVGARETPGSSGSAWVGQTSNDYGLFDKDQKQIGNSLSVRDEFGLRDLAKLAVPAAAVYGAGLYGTGAGAAEGGAATAATTGGTTAASTTPSWLASAGQGALKGAATGAIKAGVTGGSVLEGAIKGGVAGGVGGGVAGATGSSLAGQGASGVVGSQMKTTQPVSNSGGNMLDNINWGDVAGGAVGAYNSNRAYNDTKDQMTGLQGLFGQDSPYAQMMRQTLERKDAAGGRRSQYGTREVELQARLAENAARLAPTLATMGQTANTQRGQQYSNILTALQGSGIPKELLTGIQTYLNNTNLNTDYYSGNSSPTLGGSGDPYNEGGYYDSPTSDWYSQEGP